MIHHLSYPRGGDSVNAGIEDVNVELGRFDQAADYVVKLGRGCWMAKIDIAAAYRCVGVRPEDWPLLGIHWNGQFYFDKNLPFGLSSSCKQWERYSSTAHWLLRHIFNIDALVHFIDDFLDGTHQEENKRKQARSVAALFAYLGLPVSIAKLI